MKRFILSLALWFFASLANAGMTLSAVAVPPSQVYEAAKNEQLFSFPEKKEKDGNAVYLDKAWHGIHYLLTGSAFESKSVLGHAIMGGRAIGKDKGYGPMRLLSPEQVKAIAEALSKITPEQLSARYDARAMAKADIYPDIWVDEGPGALKYLLSFYGPLQSFYKQAAKNGHAVLLVIA